MKQALYLALIVFIFATQSFPQETVTNFESEITLALMEKTIPPTSSQDFFLDTYVMQHIKSNKIERAIVDKENKVVFGYKLKVIETDNRRKFEVIIESDNNPLKGYPPFKDFERKSLKDIPRKLTINDGDTIVLDLLQNPKTMGKIQDLIKVTRERKTTSGYFSEFVRPKNFTLNDLSLQLVDFKLYLDDKLLEERPRSIVAPVVAPYIKGLGTFVLSPIEGTTGQLSKIGVIDDNKIIVKYKGKLLRLEATSSILGKPGKWNLWGKFEPETEKQRKKFDVKTDDQGNSYVEISVKFILQGSSSLESYFAPPKKGAVRRRRNVLRFNN